MKGVITDIQKVGNGYEYTFKIRSSRIITNGVLEDHDLKVGSPVEFNEINLQEASDGQRKLYYAFVEEIARYYGEKTYIINNILRKSTMEATGHKVISFQAGKSSMSVARDLIDITMQFCWQNGLYANGKIAKMLHENAGDEYMYYCIMNKISIISGQPAEIHHVDAVGIGRDRDKIIQIGMYVLPLTREEHQEAHRLGNKEFLEKHILTPMKLTKKMVMHLKMGVVE